MTMQKTITNITIPEDYEPERLSFSRLNLFFIKSKHAFRQFKNHDYFQSKRHQITQGGGLRSTQFVNSPAPYGINNAYNYICTEVSRNLLGKSQHNQFRSKICSVREQSHYKTKTNIYNSSSKRKNSYQLPNLSYQSKRIKPKQDHPRSLFAPKFKTQQTISLHFIERASSSKFLTYQLKLNIYPYIISTFLKCKLNYSQLTEQQFSLLKAYILEIYSLNKQYVEYKDMVNIKSIKQFFSNLESNCDVVYKKQMIRYFFVANQMAYEYQFAKIKDQIKKIIAYQLNKDASHQDIFIFCQDTGQEITNLYQIMQDKGRYVFAVDKQIVVDYRTYLKDRQSQHELASRIKKWKSIAPEQSTNSQSFKSVSSERYERLFRTVQQKRNKFTRSKKNDSQVPAVRSSQFIDRQKLCKQTNIFE